MSSIIDKIIVFPNITYTTEEYFQDFFAGYEDCSALALSLKGHVRRAPERNLVKSAVKYLVDNYPKLKTLVVYSTCGKDSTTFKILEYASSNGVRIVIPDNRLRTLHMKECGLI
ncbi:MAG: hypothetical protein K6C13_09440 [Oscillospiraceae bacterium]|nr:hypothetical protein [Oscillospiraceae bacterium]